MEKFENKKKTNNEKKNPSVSPRQYSKWRTPVK